MAKHIEKVKRHADQKLRQDRRKTRTHADLIKLYKRFLKMEEHRIKLLHRAGGGGIEVSRRRSDLLDVVLQTLFREALSKQEAKVEEGRARKARGTGRAPSLPELTVIANGGYGRGILNPGSDLDLLFLLRGSSRSLSKETEAVVQEILYMLWDVGFKVGHATRSIRETIRQANADNQTKSALIESRLIIGDGQLFEEFQAQFARQCIEGRAEEYLETRRADIQSRHAKHLNTVYLQEPHIKNGCGGLRDYHNATWVTYVKRGSLNLSTLLEEKFLSLHAYREIERAYDFLLRVRNEMHYATKSAQDILTLRLQGIVATNLGYPQKTILRRCEAFMRDYYLHTRNMFQHTTSIMERFELEQEDAREGRGLIGFLARGKGETRERFDGFFSHQGRIFPDNQRIFEDDSSRIMRLFQHCQQRHLELSPQIRQLIKRNWNLIDRPFRYRKSVRETFESILSRKGDVARTLRLMHRTGVLGRYLPEFGELTCLVQHEFFHRYTADEHTLKCIDELDRLSDAEDPKLEFFQELFHRLEDPFILYLALILHDTGRAANVRQHADASAMLAARVCRRLAIHGERQRLLIFLVDHHLTFWRTATTRNIEDPSVVAEFAHAMRNRFHLDTLFLLTYADSKGTNEEAWSDWKESLMRQLYHSTVLYLEDRGAFLSQASRPAEQLRLEVEAKLPEEFADEIDAHFRQMPDRYFRFRNPGSIIRHIRAFRKFFEAVATSTAGTVPPILTWIDHPERAFTEIICCSWDRAGLLSIITGALASQRINVLGADLFLRGDDLVIDSFRVCTTNFEPVTSPKTRQAVEELVARAFADPDFDFSEIFATPGFQARDNPEGVVFPTRVFATNEASPDYTVIEVQALDRLGLLHDMFRVIVEQGGNVTYARINTEKGAAIDSIYITDEDGRKIVDPARLKKMEKALAAVIAPER